MNRSQNDQERALMVHSISFDFMLTLIREEEVETALGLMHETQAEQCK